MARRTHLSLALALLLVLGAGLFIHVTRGSTVPDGQSAALDSALAGPDSVLLDAADRVVEAAPRLSGVWPGFWSQPHPFLLHRGPVAVLVSHREPGGDWRAIPDRSLPGSLQGLAYGRLGTLPGLADDYDMHYRTGGLTVEAAAWDRDVPNTLETLFHEWFHIFQERHFAGLRPEEDSKLPPQVYASPRFRALADVERRLLLDAVPLQDADSVRSLVHDYLAVRAERTGEVTGQVRSAETNIERKEGTAALVGVEAASLATGDGGAVRVQRRLREFLSMSMDSLSGAYGSPYAGFRFRLYGTGTAAGYLLDRLGVSWRGRIAAGEPFSRILADATSYDAGRREDLAAAALRRYGFAGLLEEKKRTPHPGQEKSRPPQDAGTISGFLASGNVRLVLVLAFEDARLADSVSVGGSGGSPKRPADGVILYPDAASLTLSAPGVVVHGQATPWMVDARPAPDSVRLTILLPALPSVNGSRAPAGHRDWPDGVKIASESIDIELRGSAATEVGPDSVRVVARVRSGSSVLAGS